MRLPCMVSAWASANHVVLGQVKTEDKSNEIKAFPKLLKILDIAGCIVTLDAAGCQKEIVRKIIDRSGDYVTAVKRNQQNLFKSIDKIFSEAGMEQLNGQEFDFHSSETTAHGQHEVRCCFAADNISGISGLSDWKGLRSVAAVVYDVTVNTPPA